eukprot:s1489_g3.t1
MEIETAPELLQYQRTHSAETAAVDFVEAFRKLNKADPKVGYSGLAELSQSSMQLGLNFLKLTHGSCAALKMAGGVQQNIVVAAKFHRALEGTGGPLVWIESKAELVVTVVFWGQDWEWKCLLRPLSELVYLPELMVGKGFLSWWCDEVLRRRGGEVVHFVEVCGVTGKRGLTESTLEVFADECQKLSDRQRFAYFQSDFMAAEDAEVMQLLHDNLPEPLPRGEEDFFCTWPRIAPMLQIAGAGARTQLVRSGLEAPEWILCLTGKMRLKLLPDERCEAGRLAPLCPFREPMGVFDEDGRPLFTVCEHLLSDVDLFAAEMAQSPVTHLDSFGPDLQRFPEASQLPKAMEVLLKSGEMACLPAGCWVQSYADEVPFCCRCRAERLGIEASASLPESDLGGDLGTCCTAGGALYVKTEHIHREEIFGYSLLPPQAKVEAALSAALGRGHGGFSGGRSVLARLRSFDRENRETTKALL